MSEVPPTSSDQQSGTYTVPKPRTRVLVVGPVSEQGGLAHVARQTVELPDKKRFEIEVCDTSRVSGASRTYTARAARHLRRSAYLVARIRRFQPDIVHLHTCSYGTFYRTVVDALTCRAMGRPYVLHIHGGLFVEFLLSLRGLRRREVHQTLRNASRVIVLGPIWKRDLARCVAGLRMVILPNGISAGIAVRGKSPAPEVTHKPAPNVVTQPAPTGESPRGAGVLFLGDLSEVKRPEDAVTIFAGLPSELRNRFPLTMVGGGETNRRDLIEKLIHRLGVSGQVHMVGPCDRAIVQAHLRRADVMLMTSRAEGLPLALLEALSAGLPVVAPAVGAIPEVIRDNIEGRIFQTGDLVNAARLLECLLRDEQARKTLGAAGRERVSTEFSEQRLALGLEAIWREVAIETRPRLVPPVPELTTARKQV